MIAAGGPRGFGHRRLDPSARRDGAAEIVERLRRVLETPAAAGEELGGGEIHHPASGDGARISVAAIAARLAELVRSGEADDVTDAPGETAPLGPDHAAKVVDFCAFRRQRLASGKTSVS